MRRATVFTSALALAASALALASPAHAYTSPTISSIDFTTTPGHVTLTVTGTDAPYVRATVVSLGEQSLGGRNIAVASTAQATDAGAATLDLATWGIENARVDIKTCDSSDSSTCSAVVGSSDAFVPSDAVPEITLPSDTTIGPADSYVITSSDPQGGGALVARWGTTANFFSRNGSTTIPLPSDQTLQESIERCSTVVFGSPAIVCRPLGLTRTVAINRTLTATLTNPQLGDISPAIGGKLKPVIQLGEAQEKTFSLTWSIYHNGVSDPEFSGVIEGLTADGDGALRPVIDPTALADSQDYNKSSLTMTLSYDDPDFGTLTRSGLYAYFRIDTVPPPAYEVVVSEPVVMPFHDYYLDETHIGIKGQYNPIVTFRVRNDSGTIVWQRRPRSGYSWVPWRGTNNSGKKVPAGVYTVETILKDAAGNATTNTSESVKVVRKKVVTKKFDKIVSAARSQSDSYVGRCSTLTKPARSGWAGSIGMYSNSKCASGFKGSVVESDSAIRVPTAMNYIKLNVKAYSAANSSAPRSIAYVSYRNFAKETWTDGRMLRPELGWHGGPTVSADNFITPHRWILWATYNVKGSAYEVKSYRVTLTYTKLVNE